MLAGWPMRPGSDLLAVARGDVRGRGHDGPADRADRVDDVGAHGLGQADRADPLALRLPAQQHLGEGERPLDHPDRGQRARPPR